MVDHTPSEHVIHLRAVYVLAREILHDFVSEVVDNPHIGRRVRENQAIGFSDTAWMEIIEMLGELAPKPSLSDSTLASNHFLTDNQPGQ